MEDLYDELLTVVETLRREGIEYALCGGLAYSMHVEPRATVDIDLLINGADFDRIQTVLKPLGFDIRAQQMNFAQGKMIIERLVKLIPEEGRHLVLDLLLHEPLPDENIWRERQIITWRGVPLCVVNIEGLIELKRGRMSDQDQVDIKNLEKKLRFKK